MKKKKKKKKKNRGLKGLKKMSPVSLVSPDHGVASYPIPKNLLCNKCGSKIIKRHFGTRNFIDISKMWDYGSCKDGIHQKAFICEGCWDTFVGTFAIKPKTTRVF